MLLYTKNLFDSSNMKKFIPLILIAFLGIVSYGNVFKNEFVFDDTEIIVNNKSIHDIGNIKAVLTTNYWHQQANAGLYRPVVFLSFAIDYFFWADNPSGYHLFNLIFHILTSILLYMILMVFFDNRSTALLAALFFSVHPVHTEAVTGIVGRAEVFSVFWFCMGWFLFLKMYKEDRKIFLIPSIISYFLALGSKENSFVLPVILLFSIYFFEKKSFYKNLKRNFFYLIIYSLVFIIYMLIRWRVLGSIGPEGSEQFFYDRSNGTVFCTMLTSIAWYFKLLFLPTNLIGVYRHWTIYTTFFNWKVLVSFGIVFTVIGLAVLFFKQKKIWQFFCLFFLITLLPVSNIIRIGDIMAERFLYLPSIGFCAVFAFVLRRRLLSGSSRKQICCSLVIIVCFASYILKRNHEWKNSVIFWEATLKDIPQSYCGNYNLALAYAGKNRKRKALEILEKSLIRGEKDKEAVNFAAQISYDTGRYDRAIYYDNIALKTNSNDAGVYSRLALSYMGKKMYDKALQFCNIGLSNGFDKVLILHTMTRIYLSMGDLDNALSCAGKAVVYDKKNALSYIKLADCYKRKGDLNGAVENYIKALRLEPNNLQGLDGLGKVFFKKGDFVRAVKVWKKAIRISRGDDSFLYYVGIAYEKNGDFREAVRFWRKIKKGSPYFIKAKNKIEDIKRKG